VYLQDWSFTEGLFICEYDNGQVLKCCKLEQPQCFHMDLRCLRRDSSSKKTTRYFTVGELRVTFPVADV